MVKVSSSGVITTTGQSLLNATDASAARTTLELGSIATKTGIGYTNTVSSIGSTSWNAYANPSEACFRCYIAPGTVSGKFIRIRIYAGTSEASFSIVSLGQYSGNAGTWITDYTPTSITFSQNGGTGLYSSSIGPNDYVTSDIIEYDYNHTYAALLTIEMNATSTLLKDSSTNNNIRRYSSSASIYHAADPGTAKELIQGNLSVEIDVIEVV